MRGAKGHRSWGVAVALVMAASAHAGTVTPAAPANTTFRELARTCAPGVHPALMGRIGTIESGGNPFAIGVVGGRLARQPTNRAEALATVDALKAGGWNYSLGLVQVNRANLARFAKTTADMLDPCTNLTTGAAILRECFDRARLNMSVDAAVQAALSCYYSGHLTRGAGYARKVSTAEALGQTRAASVDRAAAPIAIIPDAVPVDRRARSEQRDMPRSAPRVGRNRPDPEDDWFTSWGDDDRQPLARTGRRNDTRGRRAGRDDAGGADISEEAWQ